MQAIDDTAEIAQEMRLESSACFLDYHGHAAALAITQPNYVCYTAITQQHTGWIWIPYEKYAKVDLLYGPAYYAKYLAGQEVYINIRRHYVQTLIIVALYQHTP